MARRTPAGPKASERLDRLERNVVLDFDETVPADLLGFRSPAGAPDVWRPWRSIARLVGPGEETITPGVDGLDERWQRGERDFRLAGRVEHLCVDRVVPDDVWYFEIGGVDCVVGGKFDLSASFGPTLVRARPWSD